MKKRKPWGQSVQELLGIRGFTRYGLETDQGELLFFRVAPINISVLSTASIEMRIGKLQTALTLMPDLEIICTDSCECFDVNRSYLRERCAQETNPQVRDLLWQDEQMLSQLQAEMSNARQFVFVRRCQGLKREQVLDLVNTTHKHLAEQCFEIQRMGRSDIKRFLGIYFGTSMDADTMPDVDGGQYLGEEDPQRGWFRKKQRNKQNPEAVRTKDFFDCILPGTIRFFSDHYIAGDSYRCAWAIREYPPGTEEQAILAHLADRSGVTLRIYHRMVTAMEQKQIIGNSAIVASSLTAGFVRLDAVIYWEQGKYHLGYDLMVKDSPFSREWICYESLPDEVRYNAWNLEREMFQVLDRAVEQFGLSYTECRFQVINPNQPKPKDAAREARVASVSDASRKVEAQHP